MRTVVTHLWKEWREQRAILLGIFVAIPVLTAIGCYAFYGELARLALAAPAFVGGSTALTVLALSTELWAGESRRDTLAFARRLPRGLSTAFAAKTLFFLLASAATAAYAAFVLAGAGRALGGIQIGADAWQGVTTDGMTWLSPAAVTAFGLWILLVSTWIPRGAAAVGATAMMMALLALPAYLMHAAYPTYDKFKDAIPALAVGFVVVPLGLTPLCLLRGLQFARGAWSAAWRGLAVVVVLATGSYAYASHALYRWAHLTPDDPDMRIPSGYVGVGGRFAFVNAVRALRQGDGVDDSSLRPWIVDLETGTWRELGEAGTSVVPQEGSTEYLMGERGVGLFQVRNGRKQDEDARYFDGATGAYWKTLPADVVTAELSKRIETERARLSPVVDAMGRRMWHSREANALQREREDGSIESLPLTGVISIPRAYVWGWSAYDRKGHVALDASLPDPRQALPWEISMPGLYSGSERSRLGAAQYLGSKASGSGWPAFVVDVRDGTVVPAKGLAATDALDLMLPGHIVVLSTDVHAAPPVSRLFRVDPLSGERLEILLPPGVAGPALAYSRLDDRKGMRAVFQVDLPDGSHGLARLNEAGSALTEWAPTSKNVDVIATPADGSVILIVDQRRIERARWGSPDREVLFPRRK